MPGYEVPKVDVENPLYCPSVPAVDYLQSIRKQARSETRHRHPDKNNSPSRIPGDQLLQSFETILDRSLDEQDLAELLFAYNPPSDPTGTSSSSSGSLETLSFWDQKTSFGTSLLHLDRRPNPDRSRRLTSNIPSGFSDLRGSSKRGKSLDSVNDGSFELSAKADRIHYFVPGHGNSPYDAGIHQDLQEFAFQTSTSNLKRKIRTLEDELYGPPIGTETPRGLNRFVSALVGVLPGIRLREKLNTLGMSDHQRIADFLAAEGKLNPRILNLFRTSEVESLDLVPSMTEEGELNLDARDLLCVFAKPNSFLFLNEINLSDVRLKDSDMTHIHHLPHLSRLWLSNTGIGNEALFLLVSLKRSLTELDIALNPSIDDDGIPALIILRKLRFLTILGTAVAMSGLRRLGATFYGRMASVELEVPRECEIYLDRVCVNYHKHSGPSVVVDPSVVPELSVAALKRNLAVHAAYDPSLSTEGSRQDMAERLKEFLEIRRANLVVWEVINGN